MIWASQNRPQTLPKRLQNRWSQKTAIFRWFLIPILHSPFRGFLDNVHFPWGKSLFSGFQLRVQVQNQFTVFSLKLPQNPFQNEVRGLQKSMLKTYCFSTSIFGGFGLEIGASWASKMEPSWPQNRFFRLLGAFLSILQISVF